ncbi:MAG TPA: family 10 glycosylhydrolase [Elainellaceae cyanobacterium]
MRYLKNVMDFRWLKRLKNGVTGLTVVSSLIISLGEYRAAQAQLSGYCQLSSEAIAQKQALLRQAIQGDRNAQNQYKSLISQHSEQLNRCRNQNWPREQAIWVRLYPCDARLGELDKLFDQFVNRGYNRVYVEVFYDGQVLLPVSDNQTPWTSVIRHPRYSDTDLLAQAIAKGRERGLKVYAWMFAMNFGYSYTQDPNRQEALARNGHEQTSLTANMSASLVGDVNRVSNEVFIDPYNLQAKQDYYLLVQSILRRRPDGVLYDYIRYPRGMGSASVASQVQDLWIYGTASRQALRDRALNQKGRELIQRFLNRGYITAADISDLNARFPDEGEPLWQGRSSASVESRTLEQLRSILQTELWQLSVAHALQGVLDFLSVATLPAQQQGIPAGAVFFPEANATVGRGYDSRLQPWDQFPSNLEWHPMAYGICGNTSCIIDQIQRVLSQAPAGTQTMPVLAGTWGSPISNRPSLEAQMQALRRAAPQINSVSHFAFSWQDPQSDRDRKFCQLQ